jgi:WD40 repeat protein
MASAVSCDSRGQGGDDWQVAGKKGKPLRDSLERTVAGLSLAEFPPLGVSKMGGSSASLATPQPTSSPVSRRGDPLAVIRNVHQDDVHGLLPLNNATFISGSKDGCLKQWDYTGRLVKDVFVAKDIDYRSWITALGVFGGKYWMSGTRDKYIDLWDVKGGYVRALDLFPYEIRSSTSKQRNMERVLCLVKLTTEDDNPIFFTGWPTQFTVHNLQENSRLSYAITHPNDWVYCINPLTERSILVVTGSKWEVWNAANRSLTRWQKGATLIAENPEQRAPGQQRPFISSVTPLASNPSHFGLSLFNGGKPEEASIQIYDIRAQATIMRRPGHEGRTWKIESLSPNHFASCGDEGTVKIWDMRQEEAVVTFTDNLRQRARVSSVLKLDDYTIVSASCPDNLRRSADKAQFCFRDIRSALS